MSGEEPPSKKTKKTKKEPSQLGTLSEEPPGASCLDADGLTMAEKAKMEEKAKKEEELKRKMGEMLKTKTNPDLLYDMDKPYLGHALIVNNIATEFPGSEEDVEKLKEVYKVMGFKVKVETDCNKDEMEKLRKWMISDEKEEDHADHADSNCFMLTTMSHGTEGGWLRDRTDEFGKRRSAWNIEEIVRDLNKVLTLVNKPKILVIYACRGGQVTSGQPNTLNSEDEHNRTADMADFYIAYGTVPGYRSVAPRPFGSFYFQSLAKNLKDHYLTHSIDRIFTCVRREVESIVQDRRFKDKHENMQEVPAKQCPEDRSSLRRVLMFSEFYKQHGVASIREKPILKAQLKTQKENAEQQEREMKKMSEEMQKIAKMETPDRKTEALKEMNRRVYKTIKEMHRAKNEATPKVPRKIAKASQLKCTVTQTTEIGLFYPRMCLLSDDTVVVAGTENGDVWFINSYNQESLKEKSEKVPLKREPHEMMEVELGDTDTVAMSCRDEKQIEFRDVTDLSHVVLIHPVKTHEPGLLHASGPSLLYYSTLLREDQSKKQCSVRRDCSTGKPRPAQSKNTINTKQSKNLCTVRSLDCSADTPRPAKGEKTINTKQDSISDMCCACDGDKQLLITTGAKEGVTEKDDKEGVFCYNMQDGKEVWRVSGKLEEMKRKINAGGVTTNGRGLIYVCDLANFCIQVFHVTGGKHLGRLKIEGGQGLGEPDSIRWCENTLSLIVIHVKNGKNQISVIKVEEQNDLTA